VRRFFTGAPFDFFAVFPASAFDFLVDFFADLLALFSALFLTAFLADFFAVFLLAFFATRLFFRTRTRATGGTIKGSETRPSAASGT